jgi:SprT protein
MTVRSGEGLVTPIGKPRQREVIAETARYLDLAGRELGRAFPLPAIRFDLRGRMAGMYRVRCGEREIRYNPWLFARDFPGHVKATVPHEAAHCVVHALHGRRRVCPHGREWREIMHLFGAEARACGNYSLEGVPIRRMRRYDYACHCRRHRLSAIRHKRVQTSRARYCCRYCRGELVYAGALNAIGLSV